MSAVFADVAFFILAGHIPIKERALQVFRKLGRR